MNSNSIPPIVGNILIVDDTPLNLRLLSTILTEQGYIVRKSLDGSRALQSIARELPDLILLDVKMPGMNGYQVCEQLKSQETTREIPIIFISALNESWDKVKAFKVGGADYITKPFQVEEVLVRVANQLTLHRQYQQLIAQNLQLRQEIEKRQQFEAELAQANRELEYLACIDGLTQVANRRHFDTHLAQEWYRQQREQQSLSLILCDIDRFKNYNDTYGHQAGDNCLQAIAQVLQQSVMRPADLVARYGGEEFAVILPNTETAGAVHVANRIREAVQCLQLAHPQSDIVTYVTLSMGLATLIPTPQFSLEGLIAAADRALYQAKHRGRNCLVIDTPLSP